MGMMIPTYLVILGLKEGMFVKFLGPLTFSSLKMWVVSFMFSLPWGLGIKQKMSVCIVFDSSSFGGI